MKTEKTTIAIFTLFIFAFCTFYYYFHSKDPLEIGVISNSADSPETYEAIKFFVNKRIETINQSGGIHGRRLQAQFRDNGGNNKTAQLQVADLLKRNNLIALIGIWNSSRAKQVVPLIAEAEVPLIGYFSDTEVYKSTEETENGKQINHKGIYTGMIGLTDELKFFKTRLINAEVQNVVYIGRNSDRYSNEYLESLGELSCSGLIQPLNAYKLSKSGITSLTNTAPCTPFLEDNFSRWGAEENDPIASSKLLLHDIISQKRPDLLVLSFSSSEINEIIKEIPLEKHGKALRIYSALGDIGNIISNLPDKTHPGIEFWDTADQGIPHANNQRLEKLYSANRDELERLGVSKNVIGFGGIYSDLVGIIADSTIGREYNNTLDIRKQITNGLPKYQKGVGIFRGWSKDWAFTSDRSAAFDSRLAWSPSGLQTYVLAPSQYTSVRKGVANVEVLYTNIDIVEFRGLNDSDGEVGVEFHLGLKKISPTPLLNCNNLISYVTFPNVAKSKLDQHPLLQHRLIDKSSETLDEHYFCHELYRVSGRFKFHPNLKKYPFDQQTIQIAIQASNNQKPVLIQPPAKEVQDKEFISDDWKLIQQYVGVDQDVITSLIGYGEKTQVTPFYKFHFTWIMEREIVDYFLKVIIPVLVLIIITYVAIFIPIEHFEATVGIQVTALLAAIALYFSIDKPITSYATLSDWVFVASYITITLMLTLSVLYATLKLRGKNSRTTSYLWKTQVIGYPVWILLVMLMVYIKIS